LAPLIPYAEVPELPLSFLTHLPLLDRLFDPHHPPSIKPFGTLVALGVYIGSIVAMRHARQRGLDPKTMSEVVFAVVGLGFVGGHMLDAVFYHPHHLAQDPTYLFKLWDGLSSYGGFTGAVLGALLWRQVTVTWKPITIPWGKEPTTLFSIPSKIVVASWSKGTPVLPYVECVNSAFPLAWVFGRMGCSSVHDHPGRLSDAWYALRWPMPGGGVVGRLDLGFIEMVLTIPLAVAFLILWHRKPVRPLGFYSGWMCVAYAPVRFFLDFLRENEATPGALSGGDPRYGGLTPAQWACFGLLALGILMVQKARSSEAASTAETPANATQPETEEGGERGESPMSSSPSSSPSSPPSSDPPTGTDPSAARRSP
jgi:phosphatidylglycerol:prolipoprotein diacylglycerol transferase